MWWVLALALPLVFAMGYFGPDVEARFSGKAPGGRNLRLRRTLYVTQGIVAWGVGCGLGWLLGGLRLAFFAGLGLSTVLVVALIYYRLRDE